MVPMWWGLFITALILVTLVSQILVLYYGRKTRQANNRLIEVARELRDETIDAMKEARGAGTWAMKSADRAYELARGTYEVRAQCAEILEDVRALRGWPSDEVKRHPGPTPPAGELPGGEGR